MILDVVFNSSWSYKNLAQERCRNNFNQSIGKIEEKATPQHDPFLANIRQETVLGIVYRLAGEIRPLWMILEDNDYLGIVNNIEYSLSDVITTTDITALRKDIANVDNPSSVVGVPKKETNNYLIDPMCYQHLLFPLTCSGQQLYDLIVNDKYGRDNSLFIKNRNSLVRVVQEAEARAKEGTVKLQGGKTNILGLDEKQREEMLFSLVRKYSVNKELFKDSNDVRNAIVGLSEKDIDSLIFPYKIKDVNSYTVFCFSGMYMCANYISNVLGIEEICEKKNTWQKGISKRLFSKKDILSVLSKSKNTVIHSPCDVQKKDGRLRIQINLDDDSCRKIMQTIEDAHVGCFTVGKKGLAYIEDIKL